VRAARHALALLAAFAAPLSAAAADASPARVAVLLPFVGDALAETPGPFTLVATVRRSLHEPAGAGVVDLGNPHSPSFERLAEARPTLVVGDRAIHGPLASRLAVGGARVVLLDTNSIDATFAGLDEVGRLAGVGDAMAAKTRATRASLGELALARPVPVLVVFGAPGSFLVVTQRTWIGDLLATLGFSNVGDVEGGNERFPGLVALGDERIAALRPELVLLVAHGDPKALGEALAQRLAAGGPWGSLGAAATRGVHALDPRLFSANPGLALPAAAGELVGLAGAPAPAAAARP